MLDLVANSVMFFFYFHSLLWTLHLHFLLDLNTHSEKKLCWKLVQQFPQLVYYLQITSYLFFHVDEEDALLLLFFFDSPEIRCFIIRPTWNCRNELFPRKPIIIWREWISSERSKKQQQRQAFFGPSTNQNNGSSSSLKLYRFNGVLLQLSANRE